MADERARALRKAMTAQEVKLWSHLRSLRKSHGWHFRRQAPFGSWILDFVCFKAGLVIELDGSQHGESAQAASDRKRDAFLRRKGFVVLRFWNRDVDEELDGVWLAIMDALRAAEARMLSKDRNPHPSPSWGRWPAKPAGWGGLRNRAPPVAAARRRPPHEGEG